MIRHIAPARPEEVEAIHEASLRVLVEVGVAFPDAGARALPAGAEQRIADVAAAAGRGLGSR